MGADNNKRTYFLAVLISLITGLSFLFIKIALRTSDPFDILAYRFTAAAFGVFIAILFKRVKLNYRKERIKRILPVALLYPLLFFAFQTIGLQYASSSEGSILLASSPIFTLILATYVLGERTSKLQKMSVILSVTGVIYIFAMKGARFNIGNTIGILLLLAAALSISGYNVLARKLTKDFTHVELSCTMIIISFLCYNTITIVKHLINGTISTFFAPLGNISFILSVLYLGILSSLVTSLLTNFVLTRMEASRVSVFSNLGTVISIIAGVTILGEDLYYYHIIGFVFIISGIVGTNFFKEKN